MNKLVQIKQQAILFILISLTGITGCASTFLATGGQSQSSSGVRDLDIVAVSHMASDALLQQAGDAVMTDRPILVTSFVNIDNLKDSSSFGRIAGEQVGSRMTQRGYSVTELRLRQGDVLVQKRKGEFVLTRDLKKLMRDHEAQGIVTGTYAVAANMVYVTTKLVSPATNSVIASSDYSLPLGPNTRKLLGLKEDKNMVNHTQSTQRNVSSDQIDWLMM